MDVLTGLKIIYNNLDELTVKGFSNADRLAGCGHMLDDIIATAEAMQAQEKKAQEDPKILSEGAHAKDLVEEEPNG